MLPRLTFALTVALLLVPLAAQRIQSQGQGQETYTLKLKKGEKGSTTHVQKTQNELSDVKIADNTGNALKDELKKQVKTSTYDETILERPDSKKKPTGLKRTYQKATVKVDEDTKVLPYQGKTIIIEKKGGKFQFRYENGGEITGPDAELLDNEFNKDKADIDMDALMLPGKAVAVGEVWMLPTAAFAEAFDKENKLQVDADKSKATGKLTKAYKKDGKQYGDLEFTFEFPVKLIRGEGGENIVCEPETVLILTWKASSCIDGSLQDARTKGTMHFKGLALIPSPDNPMFRLNVSMRGDSEEIVTEGQKK